MKIIWYNPDQKTYKSGLVSDLDYELSQSDNCNAYTVLMKYDDKTKGLAKQVLRQLNALNTTKSLPIIL